MTDQQHPITPPPDLVEQWEADWHCSGNTNGNGFTYFVATRAAQWGADKELLACGNYLKQCAAWEEEDVIEFYNYRRPKPPSLKEQALKALNDISIASFEQDAANTIRQALESLPD
jgi:hypothetical protein